MGINELKYKNEIENFDNCPPIDCIEMNKDAYRFIKNTINEESFLPASIQNPSRILKVSDECIAYGLSMYKDEDSARQAYTKLKKRMPRIHKIIGNKLARGYLTPEYGLCSPNNSTGHFTFHEYLNKDVKTIFHIIGDL